jgi:polyferredoxin
LFQFPTLIFFCFIIYAGIAGHAVINIAPLITWTVWWAGLVLLVLFFGKAWCFVCPWDFIASLVQFLKPFGVTKQPLTLGLKWPQSLKNIYLAIGLFIVLTFFELGYKITSSPRDTAVLAIVIICLSLIPALIFERRLFCKYACMVGRISGLYAMFSPIEIRSKNKKVCENCKTKDCYNGNDNGNPCPTALTLSDVDENTYCLLCSECIKSCPNDNVAINIRPFGTDFKFFKEIRHDEAILAVILLALTSFHGLTMTTIWDSQDNWSIIGTIKSILGTGDLLSFAIAMVTVNLSIIGIYYFFCILSAKIAGDPTVSSSKVFKHYGYSILPVALFYHLGHNAMHYFSEGQKVIPLLSDPLGQNMNIFGTAGWQMTPLLSESSIWTLQVMLVLIGHISGIGIAHRISRRLYDDKSKAIRSLIPMLMAMILSSFLSLWIMHLDMYMRSLM